MKTKLKSVEEEKQDCIEAFRANPDAKFAWCCHHDVLIEALTNPRLDRIDYISKRKPKDEQTSRFRSFRPVRVALTYQVDKALDEYSKVLTEYSKDQAEYDKVLAEYAKVLAEYVKTMAELEKAQAELKRAITEYYPELTLLHNQDWPDHTWNGERVKGT